MASLHPAGPLLGSLAALGCLAFSLRQRRSHRLLADLPTSKVQGIFIGLVELTGTAESENPLISFLAAKPCVDYRWKVEEHYRRTRTETYTDSKGNTKTRTVTDTGWDTVAQGGEDQSFYLQDDTGAVLVYPAKARVDRAAWFETTVTRGDALYHGKGPDGSVSGSTGRRRFTEEGLPLHAPLYVVGTARERRDLVAPELAHDPAGPEFILSTRTENSVSRRLAVSSWIFWALGLLALPVALLLAGHRENLPPPPQLPAWIAFSACGYVALALLGWAWMAHDSIVGLRERVRQAWSLVDVQLKRRHDLIPALTTSVAALATHEKTVLTSLARLRAQAQATRPGAPGPDFEGLAVELRAVAERYPELRAQEGFAALERALIDTEQRIALARAYYNDIATHYATRLEIIPDRWIAALRKLAPEPLLAATGFERAPVAVNFAK
jgi:hypothetical protein